jgi:hypothetical protein
MSVTKPRGLLHSLARIGKSTGAVNPNRTGTEKDNSSSIRMMLASRMAKAKRNGGWFKLTRLERGLLSLAIQTRAKFEGFALVRAVVSILRKLNEVCSPMYGQLLRGTEIARAFSEAAASWGHMEARFWGNDRAYALFLGKIVAGAGKSR